MAIDFNDPTTWDEEMSNEDALNLAIFALNSLAHPEGSSEEQFAALDFFTEGAIDVLAKMREDEDQPGEFTCAECGTTTATTFVVTTLDPNDVRTTRTEVCLPCHVALRHPLPTDENGHILTSAEYGETWVVHTEWSEDHDGRVIDPAKEEYPFSLYGDFVSQEEAVAWIDAYPDFTEIHEMRAITMNRVRPEHPEPAEHGATCVRCERGQHDNNGAGRCACCDVPLTD